MDQASAFFQGSFSNDFQPSIQGAGAALMPEPSGSQYPEELTLQLKYVSDLKPKRLGIKPSFDPFTNKAGQQTASNGVGFGKGEVIRLDFSGAKTLRSNAA